MVGLIEKLRRRHVEPTFTATLSEIESFKKLVAQSQCPGCTQSKTLKVGMFSRGPRGWEATITCSNCDMQGIVNSTGFKFERLEKDGRTRSE